MLFYSKKQLIKMAFLFCVLNKWETFYKHITCHTNARRHMTLPSYTGYALIFWVLKLFNHGFGFCALFSG